MTSSEGRRDRRPRASPARPHSRLPAGFRGHTAAGQPPGGELRAVRRPGCGAGPARGRVPRPSLGPGGGPDAAVLDPEGIESAPQRRGGARRHQVSTRRGSKRAHHRRPGGGAHPESRQSSLRSVPARERGRGAAPLGEIRGQKRRGEHRGQQLHGPARDRRRRRPGASAPHPSRRGPSVLASGGAGRASHRADAGTADGPLQGPRRADSGPASNQGLGSRRCLGGRGRRASARRARQARTRPRGCGQHRL